MLKVLSTKLLDEKLIAAAREMGMKLDCIEVIGTHALDYDISLLRSDSYDAIVFTSSNAAKAVAPLSFGEGPGVRKIYALSGKTKDELKKNGITPIAVADNAEQLSEKIISAGNIKSVLHVCGNLKLNVLENKLAAAGISYKPLVVYETIPLGNEISETYDAIMFYSPSGVESFLTKNKLDRYTLYCCIGETTAGKLKSIDGNVNLSVPKEPIPEAMLEAIKEIKISKEI
jgi:uroporphyrinogen-III synthase